MADTEYTREQALEVATLFRSFTKSSHRWHDGRPLHLVAADMLEHLAAIPAASLREQEGSPSKADALQAVQWLMDAAGVGASESAETLRNFIAAAPSSEGDEGSGGVPSINEAWNKVRIEARAIAGIGQSFSALLSAVEDYGTACAKDAASAVDAPSPTAAIEADVDGGKETPAASLVDSDSQSAIERWLNNQPNPDAPPNGKTAVPIGWKLVPVKLTPEMAKADPYGMGYGRLDAIWNRLLNAAPAAVDASRGGEQG